MTELDYPSREDYDLVLTSKGCTVYYVETSKDGAVSYEACGWSYGDACPECGSEDLRGKGSWEKCMSCGTRITLEYLEAKVASSG